MPVTFARPVWLGLVAALGLGGAVMAQDAPPVVAAASDLQFAMADIVAAFRAETGQEVVLATGSTGILATQIRNGAPFQMFMAADETFVADLHADGFTRDAGLLYAQGRLVVTVPAGSLLRPDAALDDLAAMIDAGTLGKFAIANPEHAPYGQRAQEVLTHRGLWDTIQPHLILGENVSQAAAFALSGNADGGIIAYSFALAPQVAGMGDFALIPAEWHAPLLQRMVLLNTAGPVAEDFYRYLQSEEARAILATYGFVPPEGP